MTKQCKIDIRQLRRRLLAGAVVATLSPVLVLAASAAPAEAATPSTVAYYGANAYPINGNELSPTARVADYYEPNGTGAIRLTLGSGNTAQGCTAPVTIRGYAQCSLGVVWQKAGQVPLHIEYSGDSNHEPASSDTFLTVDRETTYLALTPTASSELGAPVTLKAWMSAGIYWAVGLAPGQPLTFTLGSGATAQTCAASTDGNGFASCTIARSTQPVGTTPTAVAFAQNDYQDASAASGSLSTTRVATSLALTSANTAQDGSGFTLSAILTRNSAPAALAGQTVNLSVGSGSSAQSCSATTDQNGLARCTLSKLTQPGGAVAVAATFAGDKTFLPSAAQPGTVYVSVPTALSAAPAAASASVSPPTASAVVRAMLLDVFGVPVVGQVVIFSSKGTGPMGAGAGEVCRTTTDARGIAFCTVGGATGQAVLGSGYDAAFAAKSFYLASSAHGGPASTPAGPLPPAPLG